ncbi:MAG: PadR family transcriptional regulator [Thermomicrobiales bacterium]
MSARNDGVWDERALLLLGVLAIQRQHGYQINDFIERCGVTAMKKPTAYALLDRLAAAGYIAVATEQAGNRPIRKVYEITDEGRVLFRQLLERNIATADMPIAAGDIGLMFVNHLSREEALTGLRQRLDELDAQLATRAHATLPADHGHLSIALILEHQAARLRADRDWLAATIDRLELEAAEAELSTRD